MLSLKTVFGASFLASTAMAHFTLDYPMSRGFDEDIEPQFCGGFNNVEARQPFPLTGGVVRIDSHHTIATVVAFVSTNANPTSFGDFNTTSNGTDIPVLTNYFQVPEGEACWTVDMAGLNVGLTNGSLVTLQVQFDGGDGSLYQCTDLILLQNYTTPSNETCATDATTASGASASASGSSTASMSMASGGSSSAASGSAATSASSAAASSTPSSGAMPGVQVASWGVLGLMAGILGVTLI